MVVVADPSKVRQTWLATWPSFEEIRTLVVDAMRFQDRERALPRYHEAS